MKLHYTTVSPYVRKATVTAIEAGVDSRIERVEPSVSVWVGEGDPDVALDNPIGKVPTLVTLEGLSLTDSSLICEYLSSLAPDKGLLPLVGPERWKVLGYQALAHGLLDAVIVRALETQIRPDQYSWPEVIERQTMKIVRTLDTFERKISGDQAPILAEGTVNLGSITLACTLGYLVQRLGIEDWRENRPGLSVWYDGFSTRPSMIATKPPPIPPPHLDPRKT